MGDILVTNECRLHMLDQWEIKFRFKYYHLKHYVINIYNRHKKMP